MGCAASTPKANEAQSYLKPLKRFNMTFSVPVLTKNGMKRIRDYEMWTSFLSEIMDDALRSEWESEHGLSMALKQVIPCSDIQLNLIKVRRGYKGILQWTSLSCKTKYIIEYIIHCITDITATTTNPMRSMNLYPDDIWIDSDDESEDPSC